MDPQVQLAPVQHCTLRTIRPSPSNVAAGDILIAIRKEEDRLPRPQSEGANIVSAITAVVSAVTAIAALLISIAAYKQSQNSNSRLNQQAASNVYIGEAPGYAYAVHPKIDGAVRYVVMNTTGSQVNNVWVEGKKGKYVIMWGVQGCTMYALPKGFMPVAVDYTDANGRWRNVFEGNVQENGKPLPKHGDESSPWDMGVQNCA